MNLWMLAAILLLAVLVPLVAWAGLRGYRDAMAALAMASAISSLTLLVLTEAFGRPALADLALVLAFLSSAGTITFARFVERGLG